MIIVKGVSVIFDLTDGSSVRPRASAGMMHDPTGRAWPKKSLLVGAYQKGGITDDVPEDAKRYLGRNYSAHEGSVDLPPKRLGEWEKLGEVETIYYRRPGTRAPGKFHHEFNKPGLRRLVHGTGRAMLYARGSYYRLELPRSAIVDDRGIVWP